MAEFFVIEPETILTNYADARAASEGIVADFACDVQLTTMADTPGSLERQSTCSAVSFSTERPTVWSIPVVSDESLSLDNPLDGCGYQQCTFNVTESTVDDSTSAASKTLQTAVLLLAAVVMGLW